MTHQTHRKFAVPMPHRIFDYFNAFIGTSILMKFILNMILDIVLWVCSFRNVFEENNDIYLSVLGYQRNGVHQI